MDFRFSILVIYIKLILNIKKIKNIKKQKSYIISFAWANILLTFLQDILVPLLLPRLLNEESNKVLKLKLEEEKEKEKLKY